MDRPRCERMSPPEWRGHWRDWHRGHGCDHDPEAAIRPFTGTVGELPQNNYARRLAWEANQPPDPNREYLTDYECGYKRGAADCRGIVDKLDALAAQRDELLAACKLLVTLAEANGAGDWQGVDVARQVIARAEGK